MKLLKRSKTISQSSEGEIASHPNPTERFWLCSRKGNAVLRGGTNHEQEWL
jgi:hypothetical protein